MNTKKGVSDLTVAILSTVAMVAILLLIFLLVVAQAYVSQETSSGNEFCESHDLRYKETRSDRSLRYWCYDSYTTKEIVFIEKWRFVE